MSDSPESPPPLDLSDLRLMPKWVSEFGKSSPSPAADYPEEDARSRDRRDGRGPRDQQRRSFGGGSGGGTGGPPRGDRRPFDKPRGPGDQNRGPRSPGAGQRDDRRAGGGGGGAGGGYRQDRGPRPQGRGGRDDRDRRGGGGGYGERPRFEQAPPPVAGLNVQVEPEAKATEAMAAMIRTAGKAYSVFDAARLVLASGDRFHVRFKMAPDAGTKLYAVPTDGSLWLSREEALTHVIHGEAISSFYKVEEVELEEPKGNFTSVAVCGMTGEMLGPPSHHSYQTTLHKIHREQFSHLPFEDYKRRVRTESTPEAVAKWKESLKHGQQWTWLKGEVAEGEEPKTFKTRSEMESHFRTHHADTLVGEVTDATVAGNIPKRLLSPSLYNHLRRAVDEGRKHLLSTAQQLCSGFERHGLKLFKRRGGKLWVSRTRPRLLEGHVVLSARIAKMVEIIKTQPGIQVKKLIETVAPSADGPVTAKAPAPSAAPAPAPVPAVAAPLATEEAPVVSEPAVVAEAFGASAGTELPPIELAPESATAAEASTEDVTAVTAETAPVEAEEAAAPAEEAPAAQAAPTPAPTVVIPIPVPAPATPQHEWTGDQLHALQDLHWLNSEGYVIEYADGVVFPGVTEPPPPKPKAAPAAKAAAGESTAATAEAETPADGEAEASADVAEEAEEVPSNELETEAPAAETETAPHGEAESVLLEAAAETEAPVEVEAAATEPAPEAASDVSSESESEAEAETQPATVEEEK